MISELHGMLDLILPYFLLLSFAAVIIAYFIVKDKREIEDKVKKDLELSFSQKAFYRNFFTDKDKELLLKEKEIQILKKLLNERLSHEERTEESK
jgi:hypothetical protein